MRTHLLLPALVITSALNAQQLTINLGDLAGKKNITLIASDNTKFELAGTKFSKSSTIFNKFTFYVKLEQAPVTLSPTVIHFGELNPTRGMNINFVKLAQDGEYLKGILKKGFSGYSTHSDSEPYSGKKTPEPVKQADGKYIITLTEPLSPGLYAFASEERAWVFSVPEKK